MLSREQMREKMRGPIAEVAVPEWGEGATVGVRRFTAADLIEMRGMTRGIEEETDTEAESEANAERNLDVLCETLSRGLCDAGGERMFTADELRGWDAEQYELMYRLMEEIQSHNGIDNEGGGELEKNSVTGQTSGSI